MKKYFIFDFDDTIADTHEFSKECYVETLKQFADTENAGLYEDFFEAHQGYTIEHLYIMTIQEFDLKVAIDDLLKFDKELMINGSERMKLFPFVKEMLGNLKAREKKLYICTNRHSDTLIPVLKAENIFEHFELVISCNDLGLPKPNPKSLKDLIIEKDMNPSEVIYFGDSKVDYDFAKNAGVEYIIIDQYLNDKKFFQHIVESFI